MTATAAALPPYSGEDPRCTKCGNAGALTDYRPATSHEFTRWQGEYTMRSPLPERLERRCRRCGYQWDEALAADAQPTPREQPH